MKNETCLQPLYLEESPAIEKKIMKTMLQMKKIDIEKLKRTYEGREKCHA